MTENNLITSLIPQMQQSGFYPHPVQTPIQLQQTHVSCVLLTGDYAYKIKKPVNFGFLDFSTLEKRKHFCEEELRMNQPIAPDIYLEILPITYSGDSFQLGGTGEVVEYALKMRQFPQDTLLSTMYEQGTLTEAHLEELGRVVAQFHSQTETNDYIRSFGEIEQIRKSIDENYHQTEKYVGIAQTEAHYRETKAFTDNFFIQHPELFQQRRDNDKIRECHGDLHLRNICFWQNKLHLFDRIEFNEPFRFVDVMYDVAFTVMDLDAKERPDLGNAFLNTYSEQTGDWEGLQLLPLYLSRQAYVRAKVTSFLLDDAAISEIDKQNAQKTAAGYYRLAWEYTHSDQGKLILMSGVSGSGKSTVAKQLARKNKGIIIRSDAVRKHLAGISLETKGDASLYTAQMSEKTYARLLELGQILVKSGFTVILDAKYDRQSLRQGAIAFCQNNDIPLQIYHCTAPVEIMRDRMAQRQDISDATPDLLASQIQTFETFTEVEQSYVITVDTTQDFEV